MSRSLARAVPWFVSGALLVAAWFVAGATPDGEERITEPFPVAAEIGTPAVGRNLGVTVTDARLADRVTFGGWYAEGTWLVLDLEAWVVHTESPGALSAATLTVGDRVFRASERAQGYDSSASLFSTGLSLAVPQSGSIAFELPADIAADADAAVVRLAIETEFLGDSVIELPVDISAVERVDELELAATEWITP